MAMNIKFPIRQLFFSVVFVRNHVSLRQQWMNNLKEMKMLLMKKKRNFALSISFSIMYVFCLRNYNFRVTDQYNCGKSKGV